MDMTKGLQASARLLLEAESSVKTGVTFVQTAASQKVLPALRKRAPAAIGLYLHCQGSAKNVEFLPQLVLSLNHFF